MKINKKTFYESYIDNLEKSFLFFEEQMKFTFRVKNKDNFNVQIIKKQLQIVEKTIKHNENYRKRFLYNIKSQYIKNIQNRTKAHTYSYLIKNKNNISRMNKKYNGFIDDIKLKIEHFNNFTEIFYKLLFKIKFILEKQIVFIQNKKKGNGKQSIRSKINDKIYGNYNDLLKKEETLLSSFFALLNNNDLEKINDLDKLINSYKKIVKYLVYGI